MITAQRMVYNDYGVVHARVVVGSVFESFKLLSEKIELKLITDGIGNFEDPKIVVRC